jgi:ribonucleoside-diphosphate reductase alpha chain
LEVWKAYKQNWTEHNPSVTISVREHEWIEVANWVYENWEDVGGISFLPYSEHTYKQAPYQDCTEADYYLAKAAMPAEIDWSMLSAYESYDTTTGSQTLSCTSGSCELVDIGSSD